MMRRSAVAPRALRLAARVVCALAAAALVVLVARASPPGSAQQLPQAPPGASRATEPSQSRPDAWFNVRSYGARGDGVTDDSRALQTALDAARAAGGGVVFLPAGTYIVAPAPPAKRGGPRFDALTIGSNVWLRGDGPASVLKVKPGIGSYRSLFSNYPTPASDVENITVSDLRVDQNCAASSGTVRTGGDGGNLFVVYLAWGGRNLTFERLRFDPVCGINTVSLNAPRARNLVVRDSYFRFVKGPTDDRSGYYDNTAVYLDGEGVVATGNVFESTVSDGARGAIELHGSRGLATSNLTRWYQSCVRLVGTSGSEQPPPRTQNGFTVSGNTCSDAYDAINVWSIHGHNVRGVTVVGNTVSLAELDHLAHTRHLRYFFGISFAWDAVSPLLDGDISDVVVEGNTITAQPSHGVWSADALTTGGIALASAGNISNVVVRGNVIRDVPTMGIHVQAMGRGKRAGNVRIEGNVVVDPGNDPAAGAHRAGIVVAGRLEDVDVAHNSIVGTRVPFRGRFAIRAVAAPGSARVGIHDNLWSTADPAATYELGIEGAGVDAGTDARTSAVIVSPRPGDALTLDASTARVWELTVRGGDAFAIRAPHNATPGQRLTIRLRNAYSGPLGSVRWEGFKMSPWTSPAPGHQRALEVLWDGGAWTELFQSTRDVPN